MASQLLSHKGADWPQAQLLPDQYQDQLQFQGVKHHEAEHQQGKGSAGIQAPIPPALRVAHENAACRMTGANATSQGYYKPCDKQKEFKWRPGT